MIGENQLKTIAGTNLGMFQQYMPGVMAQYSRASTNPQDTDFGHVLQSQTNSGIASTQKAYNYGQGQLQKAFANRGIGNSSFTGNSLMNYWNGYGNQVANLQHNQANQLANYSSNALNNLAGLAGNAGTSASNNYNTLYQGALQKQQSLYNMIGSIGGAAGTVAGAYMGTK